VLERGAEVVVLALQAAGPCVRLRAQARFRLFREGEEVFCVALPQRVRLARRLEPLGGVLPDRLQHPEALVPLP
jgi:hypothetical protein